jgi:hypothetical protein
MHLSFLPKPPPPDLTWLRSFTIHLLTLAPKLDTDTALAFARHAFDAMFLLAPTEAAEIWDETMTSRIVSWRSLH